MTPGRQTNVVPAHQLIVPGGTVAVVKIYLDAVRPGAEAAGEPRCVRRTYVAEVDVAPLQASRQRENLPVLVGGPHGLPHVTVGRSKRGTAAGHIHVEAGELAALHEQVSLAVEPRDDEAEEVSGRGTENGLENGLVARRRIRNFQRQQIGVHDGK